MLGQKLAVEGVDGGVDGSGLRQHVVAVGVGLDHRLQSPHLSFNAAQAVQKLLFLLLRAQRMLLTAGTSLGFRHRPASFYLRYPIGVSSLYTLVGYLSSVDLQGFL